MENKTKQIVYPYDILWGIEIPMLEAEAVH